MHAAHRTIWSIGVSASSAGHFRRLFDFVEKKLWGLSAERVRFALQITPTARALMRVIDVSDG